MEEKDIDDETLEHSSKSKQEECVGRLKIKNNHEHTATFRGRDTS